MFCFFSLQQHVFFFFSPKLFYLSIYLFAVHTGTLENSKIQKKTGIPASLRFWNSRSPSPCLKVEDLARLQFQTTPIYIDVDDGRTKVTNERLLQGYLVVPCAKRFIVLYSFLKRHQSKKVMVVFSSCNSLKFIFFSSCYCCCCARFNCFRFVLSPLLCWIQLSHLDSIVSTPFRFARHIM
ncbi:hypothetical protein AAZX31_05G086100 [Glycine max]